MKPELRSRYFTPSSISRESGDVSPVPVSAAAAAGAIAISIIRTMRESICFITPTYPRRRSCRRASACPGVERGMRSRGIGMPGMPGWLRWSVNASRLRKSVPRDAGSTIWLRTMLIFGQRKRFPCYHGSDKPASPESPSQNDFAHEGGHQETPSSGRRASLPFARYLQAPRRAG